MKKLNASLKDKIRNPRVGVGVSLAVAAIGMLAPEDSKSYCIAGNNGDCEFTTSGESVCVTGGWWDDCL